MAFNGAGVFSRLYSWVSERNLGNKIDSAKMDAEMDGMATALSTAICRDGQTTILADIPFNGRKVTGLGDATNDQDALNRRSGDGRFQRQVGGGLTTAVSVTGSAVDVSAGRYQYKTITSTNTWSFTNFGTVDGIILELTNGGAYTQTWPASVKWPGNVDPSLTTSGVDVLVFITRDGGTTIRAQLSQRNSS